VPVEERWAETGSRTREEDPMDTVTETDGLGLVWKLEVVGGVVALVIGVIAMVWPLETAVAVVVLWGVFILLDGLGMALIALLNGVSQGRWLLLVGAAAAVLVALFAIFRPSVAAATAVWVVGIWLVLRGVLEGAEAVRSASGSARWMLLAGAALTVSVGVLFLWKPGGSVVALAFVLGLLTALRGVALLVSGLRTRRLAQHTWVGPAVA
jgi:uncharacterized membrane protein HdeD (DUF308 family)